ncbi:immunoglobulin domain-containing protein, partial [Marinilabilia sp.]|uniref:immunoglobulin domain-containing protein n=1 Tax=Marinilabilia sp. TaxID=2021252 RepID=UPI0025C2E3B1
MKRFLLSFVFLLSLLFAFSGLEAHAQGREGGTAKKDPLPILMGMESTISDVDDNYCSNVGSDEIHVSPIDIPTWSPDTVLWEVLTVEGYNEIQHPGWFDLTGIGTGTGIIFYPDQVEESYLDVADIWFRATFKKEGSAQETAISDRSEVYKSATPFVFGSDTEICGVDNATLTLEQTESAYYYTLLRDDGSGFNEVSGFIDLQVFDGSALDFVVSQEGTYAVQAERTNAPVCIAEMNGNPTVTVYPSPTPAPQAQPQGGAVGDTFCQGVPFELFDSNPVIPGYEYTWTGPGLGSGVTGHTVIVTDAIVINDATTLHTYTLTIIDRNNPTDCKATATVDIDVQERPEVAPTADPVCDGGTATLYANPSKGSGDYSFNWTSNPVGFTSILENPQITNAAIGVDDIEYIVEVTDNVTGCAAFSSGSTTLVINDVPEVTITGPTQACEGSIADYTANVTGTGTYNYQWQLDGTDLTGETSSTLSFDVLTLPSVGNHTISVDVVDVSNTTNCSASANTSLDVYETPVVTITEGDQEVCETTAVTFTSSVTGSGTYTYQWSIGGTALTGETGGTLNIDAASLPVAGTYTVSVDVVDTSSPLNCSQTASVQLTVNDVPEVTITGPTQVCEGSIADYTANVTGTGTY